MTSIRIFAATYTHSRHFRINNNNNDEIKCINEKRTVRNTAKITDRVVKVINAGGACNLISRVVHKRVRRVYRVARNTNREIIGERVLRRMITADTAVSYHLKIEYRTRFRVSTTNRGVSNTNDYRTFT